MGIARLLYQAIGQHNHFIIQHFNDAPGDHHFPGLFFGSKLYQTWLQQTDQGRVMIQHLKDPVYARQGSHIHFSIKNFLVGCDDFKLHACAILSSCLG